jgi:bacterioferritin-associated ferredoxin
VQVESGLLEGGAMIVCSCTGITDRDILGAIAWMRASDPHTLITPGKVYRALGKRAECGGCVRLFVANMRASGALGVRPGPGPLEVPAELLGLRRAVES